MKRVCVPCDGAVEVIVSAVGAARDLARPPVRVEAAGTQIIERLEWDQSTLTHEPQVLGQAAHLWTRTSDSLHFHGGYGYTLEYDIQLYFRRAKAWPLVAGDIKGGYGSLARSLYGV
jgi:alkylation response protein AidB-like acyl-CoA dehydrogenase